MNVRKALFTAVAGCSMALGATQASAIDIAPNCSTIVTVGGWALAGSCLQGDKLWTYGSSSTSLAASTQVLFGGALLTHNMQLIGFDNSDSAGAWEIKYSISVTDPTAFYISDMFAGADNPGGGSLLTKDVLGDAGGPFTLLDVDGAEGPGSEKHGLNASTLIVDEKFTVGEGKNLLSVSNTYLESPVRKVPLPGTLALLGLGLVGLGASRRFSKSS